MGTDLTPPVIAADGGGTRCRLVLDRAGARVSVESGPANVTTDFDGALAQIRRGLDGLARAAGMTVEEIEALPAYLGLAGATDRDLCARVEAALPFTRVRVEEDRAAALEGALGDTDGAIAHCGTGSFFGLRRDGRSRFVGGWGARLGDEASAYWVGRAALTGTLAAVDGLRSPSALTRDLLGRWDTPAGLVDFAGRATTQGLAALAPVVVTAAEAGDPLARDVMQAGADHLGDRLDRLGWTPEVPLCLTGGLGPAYAPYLPEQLRAACIAPAASPIDGAVARARALAAGSR